MRHWLKSFTVALVVLLYCSSLEAKDRVYNFYCATKSSCSFEHSFISCSNAYSFSAHYYGWPRTIKISLNSFFDNTLDTQDTHHITEFTRNPNVEHLWNTPLIYFSELDFELYTSINIKNSFIEFRLRSEHDQETDLVFYMHY